MSGSSVAGILSLEADILIGAMKTAFIVDLATVEKALAISYEILNNLDADIISYKKLAEFYGLANKQSFTCFRWFIK